MFVLMSTWINGRDSMKQSLPGKEDFYSRLKMEDITDRDYMLGKLVQRI